MRAGKQRGLNENLAREIMELHTLGVRTGYSQADVTEFARALTGWTVSGIDRGPAARFIGGADDGGFRFAEALHEPGPRIIMGKTYAQQGEAQARAVLLDLAASPATARHVSTKLARHFAGDDPPKAMVDRMTSAYLKSGGDLRTLYRTLIDSPEAWAASPLKFKTPCWSNTLVIVATEFGRTARPNGTGGTDHGQASVAMLLGGAVAGGKVLADWPGLSAAQLYEGRDLKPTTDLDALIAGALAQHYALDTRVMGRLFPESGGAPFAKTLM